MTGAGRRAGRMAAATLLLLAAAGAFAAPPRPVYAILVDEYHDEVAREKKAMYDAILEGVRASTDGDVRVFSFDRRKELIAPRLADARALSPAVVVALGSNALKIVLAERQRFSCPIVFSGVLHPEYYLGDEEGISGVSLNVDARTQVKVLKENLAGIDRIGVLHVAGSSDAQVALARDAGKLFDVEIVAEGVRDAAGALEAVDRLEQANVDVFLLLPDALIAQDAVFHRLRHASVRQDVPIVSPSPTHLRDDALLSFEVDYERCGRDTADLLNRILIGEAPEKIGILHQRLPRIGLNLRIARAMRIPVPARLHRLAAYVVQ